MSEKNHVPGFYFELSILGEEEVSVVAFKEVSGIQSEMEGGEMAAEENNAFKYRLPTQAKYTNLVLKRGLMPKNATIAKWCEATLSDFKIASKSITVRLLDGNRKSRASWQFENACPIKWEVSELDAINNEIAIETLEFAYSNLIRE